jgi:hypothetical protein
MERREDPSTVEFRSLAYLKHLLIDARLGEPQVRQFQIPYVAADPVNASLPEGNDRPGLLALIEESVDGDA